jgi:hypothetical protein
LNTGLLFFNVCSVKDQTDQLDFNFSADDLLDFPRDLGEAGWFRFYSEQREAYQRIERKFGLELNARVRLRLRGSDEELVGRLLLDSLLLPAPDEDVIRLRLGSRTFDSTDIDCCQVLEE